MTRRDILTCVHEPFGDAFYYGPERLSERFEDDEEGRNRGGFSDSTYQTILDRFDKEGAEVRSTSSSVQLCGLDFFPVDSLHFPCYMKSIASILHDLLGDSYSLSRTELAANFDMALA